MTRRTFVGIVLVWLAACGGSSSPSSPTTSLNLAGSWTGTWQFVTSGTITTDTITATLTQNGTDAGGTWTAQSGATGQFTRLTATASTSGSMTISQTTLSGTVCSGTTSVSGTATSATLELTIAPITPSGICQWATGQQFSLRRP